VTSSAPLAGLGRSYARNERFLLGALGLVAILTIWEVGAQLGFLSRVIMSSPTGVARALLVELQQGTIWEHLAVSILEYGLGFGLAAVVGIVLGFIVGWSKLAFELLDPWIIVLYSTPIVALIPMIILILGIDLSAKVFVVFLISLFAVVVNTMLGVQSTSRAFLEVSRAFGASKPKQWTSVVLPGSLPFILTGLRLSAGHAMVGVVVAELIAGNRGVGFLINLSAANLQSGTFMLLIVFLGAWGVMTGEIMRRIERRVEQWRP
jgi:ABC-type nitrate/sulfonate/bicarbonate transport system permease component